MTNGQKVENSRKPKTAANILKSPAFDRGKFFGLVDIGNELVALTLQSRQLSRHGLLLEASRCDSIVELTAEGSEMRRERVRIVNK